MNNVLARGHQCKLKSSIESDGASVGGGMMRLDVDNSGDRQGDSGTRLSPAVSHPLISTPDGDLYFTDSHGKLHRSHVLPNPAVNAFMVEDMCDGDVAERVFSSQNYPVRTEAGQVVSSLNVAHRMDFKPGKMIPKERSQYEDTIIVKSLNDGGVYLLELQVTPTGVGGRKDTEEEGDGDVAVVNESQLTIIPSNTLPYQHAMALPAPTLAITDINLSTSTKKTTQTEEVERITTEENHSTNSNNITPNAADLFITLQHVTKKARSGLSARRRRSRLRKIRSSMSLVSFAGSEDDRESTQMEQPLVAATQLHHSHQLLGKHTLKVPAGNRILTGYTGAVAAGALTSRFSEVFKGLWGKDAAGNAASSLFSKSEESSSLIAEDILDLTDPAMQSFKDFVLNYERPSSTELASPYPPLNNSDNTSFGPPSTSKYLLLIFERFLWISSLVVFGLYLIYFVLFNMRYRKLILSQPLAILCDVLLNILDNCLQPKIVLYNLNLVLQMSQVNESTRKVNVVSETAIAELPSRVSSDEEARGFSIRVGSLLLSSKILGYGCHGTCVFEGSLNGRPVAVKRMLTRFSRAADR